MCKTAVRAAALNHVCCLKSRWAAGCRTWLLAADFARWCESWACLDFCLQRGQALGVVAPGLSPNDWGCIALWDGEIDPEDEEEERAQVRRFVRNAVASSVARVDGENEAAARVIQTAFLRAYYDPAHALCRSRLLRQLREVENSEGRL